MNREHLTDRTAEPRARQSSRRRFQRQAVALAVVLALAGSGAIWAESGAAPVVPPMPSSAALPSFADVAERVTPAVVNVTVTARSARPMPFRGQPGLPEDIPVPELFRHFFGDQGQAVPRERQGLGSGFIVDQEGYIVTNNHVVDGASEVSVVLNDGSSHPARVVGRDDKTDLALLKIDAGHPLPYVELGDSTRARVGDWVLAVGNPFGLGGSVNAGIISARGRDIHSGPYDDYLQIDAAINRGNSGGPLFDTSGRVIGVNTAIYSPTGGNVGIGFAIPAETVRQVIAGLRDNGRVERGWLGLQIQAVTPELAGALGLAAPAGVLVADVVPDGPASKTDLRAGDVILSVNGQPLENYRDLPRMVAMMPAGRAAQLEILRDGQRRTLSVTIGQMPDDRVASAPTGGDSGVEPGSLGLGLLALTPELRLQKGIDTDGVYVARVAPDSPAARAGIAPGSIISMVGGERVASPAQFAAAVRKAVADKRPAVILRVEQDGRALFVAVQMQA